MKPTDEDRTLAGGSAEAESADTRSGQQDSTLVQPRIYGDSVTEPGGYPVDYIEESPRRDVTLVMDTSAAARALQAAVPWGAPPGHAQAPPGLPLGPPPGHFPPPAPSSDRLLLPPTAQPAVSTGDVGAPFPGWLLPYLIGVIALTLAGAFVLSTEAHVLGHF